MAVKIDFDKTFDVYAVGNALVDNVAFVEDDFLQGIGLQKGIMTLAGDSEQQAALGKLTDQGVKVHRASGGSACNTVYAMAQLGSKSSYIGKIADDTQGDFYASDLQKVGLDYQVKPGSGQTGTCLVFTTPDSERSMQTNLGISIQLAPEDISESRIAESKIAYIEGYLWDADSPRAACEKSMQIAKECGTLVAITFSDPFLLTRHGDDFKRITKEYADIVFCNLEEACMFSGKDDAFAAIEVIGSMAPMVFMTLGERGVMVLDQGKLHEIEAEQVKPIDSTGAGDMFAAGALYGITHRYPIDTAARIANRLAGQVVQVVGPRLNVDLRSEVKDLL